MGTKIRNAKETDIKTIFRFICELAEYEKLSHDVTATEEILFESLFIKNSRSTYCRNRRYSCGFRTFLS